MSVPQKYQKDPVSLEKLSYITLLAGLGLLHKSHAFISFITAKCYPLPPYYYFLVLSWALGNESADLQYTIRRDDQSGVLE